MLNLLKVEFYKLKISKLFWLMVLAGIGQGIAGPLASDILCTKTGEEMLLYSFNLQQFLFLMPILGAFAYFVGSEFHTGCIKNLISYGHKRRDIIIAKSIAFYVGAAVISFTFPIVITIINTVINGYGRPFNLEALMAILRVSFLMLLIYTGIASIAVLLAFLSRNAIFTVGIYICLDTACRVGQALSIRNKFVEATYGKTIFYQANIATLKDMTFSQGAEVTVIALITILASTAIAIVAFSRADVK
jgi:ABC-2 type transport system permease protein